MRDGHPEKPGKRLGSWGNGGGAAELAFAAACCCRFCSWFRASDKLSAASKGAKLPDAVLFGWFTLGCVCVPS